MSPRLARMSRWGLYSAIAGAIALTNWSGLAGVALLTVRRHWSLRVLPLVITIALLRRWEPRLAGLRGAGAVVLLAVLEAGLHAGWAWHLPTPGLARQAVLAGAVTAIATWRWPTPAPRRI